MEVQLHTLMDSVVYTGQRAALHSDCFKHGERNSVVKTNVKINQQSATKVILQKYAGCKSGVFLLLQASFFL